MHFLYRITNVVNQKVYIGQAADYEHRWADHRRAVRLNKPTQTIHHAIIKYGIDNFIFEVIATCQTIDDANELETELVAQYDSFVSHGKGYNATYGGMNAPKSEAWHQAMRDWRTSLSPEEKMALNQKHSEATSKWLKELGHPCLGLKWTDEQKAKLSVSLKARDKEAMYTPEVRQKMSESHLGILDSEETKQKKSESAKLAWEERIDYDEFKCATPGCEIQGKHAYIILDNIRYCSIHGQRLRRTGLLELQPHSSHNKGGTSHNRTKFTDDQMISILSDIRSLEKIAKDFGVTPKVIKRVKLEAGVSIYVHTNQYV